MLEDRVAAKEVLESKAANVHSTETEVWADALRTFREAEMILAEARQREKQELENIFGTEREKNDAEKASKEARRRLGNSGERNYRFRQQRLAGNKRR